jgi:hypothetical protein
VMSSLIIQRVFSPCSYILDHRSYGLGPKEKKEVLGHDALVTAQVCSIMVFVSSIDVTFIWMFLPLF